MVQPLSDQPLSRRSWYLPGGISERLFLLISLTLAPALALLGWISYQRYDTRRAQTLRTEMEVAQGVAAAFGTYVDALRRQNYAAGKAITTFEGDVLGKATRALQATAAQHRGVRNMSWVAPTGVVLASSDPALVGANLQQQAHFQRILAGEPWALSDLQPQGITHEVPTCILATAIPDGVGRLRGVVVTSIEPGRVQEVTLSQRRPEGNAYIVFDTRGTVVSRFPLSGLSWEQRVNWPKQDRILRQVLETKQPRAGTTHVLGDEWLAARVPIAGLGWVAGAAERTDMALGQVRRDLVQDTLLALLVVAGAFGLASLVAGTIARPIRRLEEQARKIGTGEPVQLVDLSEAPVEVLSLRATVSRMAADLIERAEALREGVRRLEQVAEISPFPTVIHAEDGEIVTVNQAWSRLSGYTRQEIPTIDAWIERAYGDRKPDMKREIEALYQVQALVDRGEVTIRTAEGAERVWDLYSGPLGRDSQGRRLVMSTAADVTERKQVERDLRMISAVVENSGDFMGLATPEGQLFYVNEAGRKMLGLQGSEHDGTHILDCFDSGDRATIETQALPQLRQGGRWVGKARFRHLRTGAVIHTLFNCFAINDAEGRTLAWAMIGPDLGPLRQAEEALRVSEERYRLVNHATNEVIWDWDMASGSVLWNDSMEIKFGYRLSEVPNTTEWWHAHIHPDDREHVLGSVQEAIDNEARQFWTAEYRFQHRRGHWVHVFDRGFVGRDEQGRPVRMIGSMLDLTERIQSEEALRRSEARFSTVMEHLYEGVIIASDAAEVLYWNPAARRMHGLARNEGHGVLHKVAQPFELWTVDGQQKLTPEQWPMPRALRGETVHRLEMRLIRPDQGWQRIVSYSGALVQTASGERLVFLSVFDLTEQRRAEQALRDSEAKFRSVFEQAAIGMARIDFADARCTDVNDTLCRMLGYSPEEMRSMAWSRLTHVDDVQRDEESFGKMAAGELDRYTVEKRLVHQTGEVVWARVTLSLVRDDRGRPDYEIAIVENITARKKAEQQLRETQQRFATLADNISQLVWMADESGHILWYNKRWYEYTGTSPEEMEGAGWTRVHHPQHTHRVAEKLAGCMREGRFWEDTFLLRGKDGAYRWFLGRAVPIHDDDGNVVRWFGTNTDVTELLETAQELRLQRAQLQAILDNAPVLITIKDLQGGMRMANRAYFDRLQVPPPERIVGLRAFDLFPPEVAQHLWENDMRAVRTGQAASSEDTLPARDGSWHTYLTVKFPVRYLDTHEPFGVCAIAVDITDRKRAEEQVLRLNAELEQRVDERTAELAAANRELESFSYTVSHDLRAPLRHITSFIRLLEEDAGPVLDEQSRDHLNVITGAAQRMSQLIDDLLTFSRLGRASINKTSVSLARLVDEARRDLDHEAAGRTIEWRLGDLPEVRGDPTLLRAVLINLLANAIKFTRERERAVIETGFEPGDGECVCFVKDNGAGFDMRYADKLFGVFQRLHPASQFEGTGIGLASVRRIIERHGGRVWAEGKEGQGATFYFSLPTQQRSQA